MAQLYLQGRAAARQNVDRGCPVRPHSEGPLLSAHCLSIVRFDGRSQNARTVINDLVLVCIEIPTDPLHVKCPDHSGMSIRVPHLQDGGPVLPDVPKQAVPRRPSREPRAQDRPVGKDEPLQQRGIVLPRRVRHVDGTSPHRARRGVQSGRLVLRVKHVPVRQTNFADEKGVVGHIHQMNRVGARSPRIEVVGGPGDGCHLVTVQILGRVAHAVYATGRAIRGKAISDGCLQCIAV
mmetsp:Transcript_1338/g.3680  ORF Transcript_1338/g.3680 Transcript_1338/m.3680 type:complete len:236 (-) Transcript_1338:699-1406(-)